MNDGTVRPLALIAAMARGRVIGRSDAAGHLGLPWHIPEDLKHFRRTTKGHAIIMGRKTFEAIGRPLPQRRNIVLSRHYAATAGVEVVGDLQTALTMVAGDELPFVIGGGTVYAAALPFATKVYLTRVDRQVEGDVVFPELGNAFALVDEWAGESEDVRFEVYARR